LNKQSVAARDTVGAKASGYKWWVLAVLTAAQSCHQLDRNVLSVVVEPVRHEFHLSDGQVGLLSSLIYAIAFAIAALPIGYMVDRFSRRNMLAAILAIWSGMTALGGLTTSYLTLILVRIGVASAEAGGSPTAMSMLSDYFPPKERSTALGIWYASAGIGTGIIFLVGGFLAQNFGWRTVFFVAAIPGFIVALTMLLTVREPPRGTMELAAVKAATVLGDEKAATVPEAFAYVLRRPSVLFTMGSIVLTAAMSSAYGLWAVSFLIRVHGLHLAKAAVMVSVAFAIFGTVIPFFWGVLGDKMATARDGTSRPGRLALVSAISMTGVVIFGTTAALSHNTPLVIGCMWMWCGLMLAHNGPANALVISMLRPRMRGTVIATLQIVAQIMGFGLGPFLVGVLSDMYGGPNSLRYAIVTGMSVNVIAVIFFLIASTKAQKDLAKGH
jgi:MFS family permease